jgi:hypothetical protein
MVEVGDDMTTETESPTSDSKATAGDDVASNGSPPTAPCSVVWSRGHAYVLESGGGRPRWMGVDDRGRTEELSGDDLRRRGWTRTCEAGSYR